MIAKQMNEQTMRDQLNTLVQLAKEYFFFFFNWGFYYWSAGSFAYKKIQGNYQT